MGRRPGPEVNEKKMYLQTNEPPEGEPSPFRTGRRSATLKSTKILTGLKKNPKMLIDYS